MAESKKIIGRTAEVAILNQLLKSKVPEFIAVYGRRRVGKTFLIRQAFSKNIIFDFSGAINTDIDENLENFYINFLRQTQPKDKTSLPKTWFQAFNMLANFAEKENKKKKKSVIFIDEVPWLDTPKSKFISALGYFWNNYLSKYDNIILVICGSAASWINKKIFKDVGGLHNRVTKRIKLLPFNLAETAAFCKHKNLKLTQYQITRIYMAFGGIPFYLKELKKGKSDIQLIDDICFNKNGLLYNEYDQLYFALFKNAEKHLKIVEALASKPNGLTSDEISKISKVPKGGSLYRTLKELNESGFISFTEPTFNQKRNGIYRLIDFYSLFYLKFIKKSNAKTNFITISNTNAYKIWCGYAFENVCFLHINQIQKSLGISGINSGVFSWKLIGKKDEKGAQIDMIIDRDDQVINLCEVKFYNKEFVISKAYYTNTIRNKRWVFQENAKTKKSIQMVLISTFGAEKNGYFLEQIDSEVILSDLFKP